MQDGWSFGLFDLVAVLVVVLGRKDMLRRDTAVTGVLPASAAERRARPRTADVPVPAHTAG
jgi:hypothetical protein